MHPVVPPDPVAIANDPGDQQWRVLHELMIRGVNEPISLTLDEVRRVSSVALLLMQSAENLDRLGSRVPRQR